MTNPKRPEDPDQIVPNDGAEAEQSADEMADRSDAAAETRDDDYEDALDAADADVFEDGDAEAQLSESEFVSSATPAERPKTPMSSRDRAAAEQAAAGMPPSAATDELPYVDDRVSKIWVGAIVATFSLILLYGLFLGNNGILIGVPSPLPSITPAPSVSVSPVPSASSAPSGTPAASGSPSASGTPGASSSPGVSSSPAPSGTPQGGTPPPSPSAGPT